MPPKQRSSRALEKAELRAAGLKAIDPALNLGDLFTLGDYTTIIEQLRTKLVDYNRALAVISSSQTEFVALERTLSDMTERMLTGVAFQFGKDSREYAMAGGVRKSERVRKSVNSRLKAGAGNQSSDKPVPVT
jgi:hypothetical protein